MSGHAAAFDRLGRKQDMAVVSCTYPKFANIARLRRRLRFDATFTDNHGVVRSATAYVSGPRDGTVEVQWD